MQRITELKEVGREIWHNVLPVGEFHDPRYGKVQITHEMIKQMADNFKKGIPHYEPPVNLSHKDELGAYGKVADLEARDDGLWAKLVLTDEGVELLKDGKFRYVSAEFAEDYADKQTGKSVGYAFLGVALTNRPAHPGVQPLTFRERLKEAVMVLVEWLGLTEKEVKLADVPRWPIDEDSPWSWNWARDADEIVERFGWATLAKACAYVDTKNYEKGDSGYPEVKAAYKLPFAKVKNGRMTIYRRGVIAAMQALLGARGGTSIPRDERKRVYNKLAGLYKRLDMEPPEFHYSEVNEVKEFEEKVRTLEERVKTLEEEKATLTKKLEETEKAKKELEIKLLTNEIETWAKDWLNKGVPPAVVEKFKTMALEEPDKRKDFEEVLQAIAKPENLKQMGEEASDAIKSAMERADRVAKAIYGGEK